MFQYPTNCLTFICLLKACWQVARDVVGTSRPSGTIQRLIANHRSIELWNGSRSMHHIDIDIDSSIMAKLIDKCLAFCKNTGQTSFCYFSSFFQYNDKCSRIEYEWKKHRWYAWDLNPRLQKGRRRRIHWAMAAPYNKCLFQASIWNDF